MTDEEMAVDWIRSQGWSEENLPSDELLQMEQAFLAGLKASRPQWHILAEEPNIMPKEGQKVKVLTEDNVIQESTYFYDDYFEGMAFSNVGLVKVLAWKEIVLPELKEGENA